MRTILTLVRKDLLNFSRYRAAVSLTFLVPVALIYIFGQVFGLNHKDSGPSNIGLAVVNLSANPAAQKLVDALKAEKSFRVVSTRTAPDGSKHALTEADARQLIHDRELRFAVVIPADLLPSDRIGLHLKILSDPRNEIETQTVNGLLQRTIFSNVPELLGQSLQHRAQQYLGSPRLAEFNRSIANTVADTFGGDREEIQRRISSGDMWLSRAQTHVVDPSLRRLDADEAPHVKADPKEAGGDTAKSDDVFSRLVQIDREQVVGKDVKNQTATAVVGGWAIMFLLFAISGSSAAFFDEKNTGIFQRILSAPVTRGQLLTSRFLFGIILGLVQLVVLFSAGSAMYGINVLGHLGNLIVVSAVAAAACTAFGMLVAAVSPNAQAANGLATFVVMVMSATGGAWFPISLMPPFMQHVGKLTIVYWSMEAFSGVLWAGNTLVELLPTLGILLGITAAVMAVALWRLYRKPIFE